ncbi:MAG: helix-turn-helix domain-containing protein [Euzebyaceae bacterium]|nr:helix-turn-helix domain-containing protein [Euzebyaceae bacterium]
MGDEELLDRVRALRSQGHSPKQIARALGVRPARVAPLARAVARAQAAAAPEPGLVGCWVSPGWSVGLTLENGHDWPDRPGRRADASGLVSVMVARERRRDRGTVSVCGYLVDTYCLGVKDALGPRTMGSAELRRFAARFFGAFGGEPLDAPIEQARELVWGGVEYARGLGFDPHRNFWPAAEHLGPLDAPAAIRFGRYGKPFYVSGPFDDADRIRQTLEERLGRDDFGFVVPVSR